MSIYIFTGPTLQATEAQGELDAVYLPPVSQGDVYRIAHHKPEAIGIIDGYFERIPSVWHKEILFALHQGIHVYGSASMGALRASELYPFGMIGVGSIFEAFRDGVLEDDDEVTVIHGPKETKYQPFSEAMVNIRSTLNVAVEYQIISKEMAEALKNLAKSRFYQERTYQNLLKDAKIKGLLEAELKTFENWLAHNCLNQKRLDAIQMLRRMKEDRSTNFKQKEVPYHFEYTYVWDQFWRKAKSLNIEESPTTNTLIDELLEEICLVDGGWDRFKTKSLMRLLAIHESRHQGFEITTKQVEDVAEDYRRSHELYKPEDLTRWLDRNGLTQNGFIRLLEDEARINWIETMFQSDIFTMLPEYLQFTGEYEVLLKRLQEKHRFLEANGCDQPELEAAGLTEEELLRWYFEKRLGLSIPNDLEARARKMGFADSRTFIRSVLKEWYYMRLSENDTQTYINHVSISKVKTPILAAGDPAPSFTLRNPELGAIGLDSFIGKNTLIVFSPDDVNSQLIDMLVSISNEYDLRILWLYTNSFTFDAIKNITIIPFVDEDRVIYQRYGIKESGAVLLDAGHRVVATFPIIDRIRFSKMLLKSLDDLSRETSGINAPILIIPNVLEKELCKELIQLWYTGGNKSAGIHRLTASGSKDVVDSTVKRRRDHFIQPGPLELQLHQIFSRRVYPELKKVFYFSALRCEQLRIGCYDSSEKGYFHSHRDNTSTTSSNRRFSMSINLNNGEYKGGHLWFPEYGKQTYCPKTGSALIFSSSLLHEAMPVLSGIRFILVTFFYGKFHGSEKESGASQSNKSNT